MTEIYSKQMIEYFRHPGLNSTLLGKFAEDPIVANAKGEAKSYFESGKAFERLFEDRVMGSNRFGERFFICGDIKIPDKFIDVYKTKNFDGGFTFTKNGEFHKGKSAMHEVVLQCLIHQEFFKEGKKYPIPLEDYKAMQLSIDRMMKMDIELFEGELYNLESLLKDNQCLFQYPVFWVSGGLQKKALYDIIVLFQRGSTGYVCALDLKYMALLNNMDMFFRNTKSKYSIQSAHYAEGLNHVEEFEEFCKVDQMPFVVAQKNPPHYVQAFMMDEDSIDYVKSDYAKLCFDCDQWVQNGRKETGIKPTKRKRIWRN